MSPWAQDWATVLCSHLEVHRLLVLRKHLLGGLSHELGLVDQFVLDADLQKTPDIQSRMET